MGFYTIKGERSADGSLIRFSHPTRNLCVQRGCRIYHAYLIPWCGSVYYASCAIGRLVGS